MRAIDYKEELSSFCIFDPEEKQGVAEFISAEKKDEETVVYKFYCSACEAFEEAEEELTEDYIYIGSCPLEEYPFPQYSSYQTCKAFLTQLKNTWAIPEGGRLVIKAEMGGGGYYEVVAHYSTLYPKSLAWALYLEGTTPRTWSPAALKQLEQLKGIDL